MLLLTFVGLMIIVKLKPISQKVMHLFGLEILSFFSILRTHRTCSVLFTNENRISFMKLIAIWTDLKRLDWWINQQFCNSPIHHHEKSAYHMLFTKHNIEPIFRSSHQRCSMKKSVLRNFTKFTGKHLCQSLF